MKIWRIKAPLWALVGGASLLTLALIGGVVIVATPAGCPAAHRFGMHFNDARCGGSAVAVLSPSPASSQPIQTGPTGEPFEVPTPSAPTPSATPYPPYLYPASVVGGGPPLTITATAGLPGLPGLSCRLPIYAGPSGSGGFLVFPGGSFVADPRSGVALPSPGGVPGPGYGVFGFTYDHARGHWLPVPRNWVLADGSRYAWPGSDGIYVANAADGTVTEVGAGHSWSLLGLDSTGAYAVVPNSSGLWLVPFSGAPRQITTLGYWSAVGGGVAYGTTLSAAPQGAPNPILRLDVKTGTSTPWFAVDDGSNIQLVGLDLSGAPIVVTTNRSGGTVWLVPKLGGAKVLATYNQYTNFNLNGSPVADAHGIWFATYEGTFLLVPDSGWFQATTIGGFLAAGCA